MTRPVVVLVGPPGSGKTSVGHAVAQVLGQPLRDTDEDVAAEMGKPIPDIFVTDGEAAFRAAEREAVHVALREHEGVLALGGGAVLDPDTRARLGTHAVVFLDVSLAVAVARVGLARDRPLLLGSPRAQLKRLMDERRALYEQVATACIDTSERSVDDVAADVCGLIEAWRHE